MRLRSSSLILRGVSLFFILAAAVFLVYQLIQYSISRSNYPSDMTIGGVPVGGLDPQSAAQRLLQVYSVPVEIHYNDAVIDLDTRTGGLSNKYREHVGCSRPSTHRCVFLARLLGLPVESPFPGKPDSPGGYVFRRSLAHLSKKRDFYPV